MVNCFSSIVKEEGVLALWTVRKTRGDTGRYMEMQGDAGRYRRRACLPCGR
jgi:hypothetical protein